MKYCMPKWWVLTKQGSTEEGSQRPELPPQHLLQGLQTLPGRWWSPQHPIATQGSLQCLLGFGISTDYMCYSH